MMKHKNLIRALVLAAIFAWPAVETYRLYLAKQAVVQSEKTLASVNQKLAQAKANHASSPVMKASLQIKE